MTPYIRQCTTSPSWAQVRPGWPRPLRQPKPEPPSWLWMRAPNRAASSGGTAPKPWCPTPDGQGHHGWRTYLDLRASFDAARRRGRITYLPGQQVWMAQKRSTPASLRTTPTVAGGSGSGKADGGSTVVARRLVLCPGGYDRQLPVPGWDLPGVMAAGGIQAFIKANGILPGRRFVIAGTGPFLLPVAANIAEAGGQVLAVLESSSPTAWLPHLRAAAGVPEKALEGAEYAAVFARHRIPYRTRSIVTEVLGTDHVSGVRTARVDADGRVLPGTERVYEDVDVVGFGWGFTPQMELPLSFGIQTRLDADGSLVGVVNERQQSSIPGLFLAGEVTGVGGATLAVLEGLAGGHQQPLTGPRIITGPARHGAAPAFRGGHAPRPSRTGRLAGLARRRTPPCAAAKKSQPARSPTPGRAWEPATPGHSSPSPAPEWAGAKAGFAASQPPAWAPAQALPHR